MAATARWAHLRLAVLGAAGAVGAILTIALPGDHSLLDVPWPIRVALASAGLALLVVSARAPRRGGVAAGVEALGGLMLAYPTVLALQAWRPHDPVLSLLGATMHLPVLVCAQLVPVLAATTVSRRRSRGWETLVVALPALSIAAGVAGDAGVPLLGASGTVLWFASLLVAPLGSWSPVRRARGEERRRIVLAGIAATVPAAVVAWCLAIGTLVDGLAVDPSLSMSVLLLGLSAAVLVCGVLATAAVGRTSRLLGGRALVGVCDALCVVLALALGTLVVVAATVHHVTALAAVILGSAVTTACGAMWLLVHRSVDRFVDPEAELGRELHALGEVTEGGRRDAAQLVLRRLTGDRDLTLIYPEGASVSAGAPPQPREAVRPGRAVVTLLTRADGSASVAADVERALGARLAALGDLRAVVLPALHEAELAAAGDRARAAADEERRRLTRNLHDGLQGRLLGLALKVQLSADEVDDPATRLLLDETVGALRAVVDDVRHLGGGELPSVLATEGLGAALHLLLTPMASFVDVDVPPVRLPAAVETVAYFVVGEAVANAIKHADATRVAVTVTPIDAARTVTVVVRDDGRGGADPRAGSGLRGISERVAAAGGLVVVRDGDAGGTVVEAVLPCGS